MAATLRMVDIRACSITSALLGPNKVNEARMSFTRVRGGIFQQNSGNDISTQLGILGTSRNPIDFGVPVINLTGYDRIGEATNLPQDRHDNTYEWADAFSWTTGKHTFKFGTEIRRFQENFLFDSSARGTLTFNPFYTAQVVTSATGVVNSVANTGNAVADLLLGYPYTASVSRSFAGIAASTVAGLRQTSTNLYAQDDFRVLPNLTLNLGVRWEYNAPTTDKYNHLATFDPNFPNSTPLPYLRISTAGQLRASTTRPSGNSRRASALPTRLSARTPCFAAGMVCSGMSNC